MLQLVPVHQSGGGMSGDGSQSYAATVISAAKVSLVLFFKHFIALASFCLVLVLALSEN